MDLRDYIEEVEPRLFENKGRHVLSCVVEFCKLIKNVMPPSGQNAIDVIDRYLSGEADGNDLVNIRVLVFEDLEKNHKGTPQGEALKAVLCGLFYPIENDEYFDTITYAIDFCRSSMPGIADDRFRKIIEAELKA